MNQLSKLAGLLAGITFALFCFSAPKALAQTPNDLYQKVFDSVDQNRLVSLLKDMTGYNPVTVGQDRFSITDRYTPESKAKFRKYWTDYFQKLGMTVTEFAYPASHPNGETEGHNVEAVLPGKSKDSIVIIVHYDSMGPSGAESSNPAVDDDMSGMATMMETARILTENSSHLQNTVRFVASDDEEYPNPGLEGAVHYGQYLKDLSVKDGFKVIAAVDDEQMGWNCAADNSCSDSSAGDTFDVFSCDADGGQFNFPELGDQLTSVATQMGGMKVSRGCMGSNSDHYAMWQAGFPAVVFSEHNPFDNPHFDAEGGDVLDRIDTNYFFKIARIGVTFAAELAGLN